MKKIELITKEDLDIYMSPMRQRLLRQLSISSVPLTPKQLADLMDISASGVQHHIRKLLSLGIIELDHTEMIHGIMAKYYRPAQVEVQIGLSNSNELDGQREALVQNLISSVYQGFCQQRKTLIMDKKEENIEYLRKWGDFLTGVVHLDAKESEELICLVNQYLEQHAVAKEGTSPWEYAVIAYKAEEGRHE